MTSNVVSTQSELRALFPSVRNAIIDTSDPHYTLFEWSRRTL
jgi:hypothetical protein